MKHLIQTAIRMRNPEFSFDPALNSAALSAFIWTQCWGMVRGLKWLFHFRNLKLGNDVHISALGKQGLWIGDNVSIGAFSRVVVSTSFNHLGEFIKIGNNVGMGEYAYLGGAGGLEIGDESIIGQYFSCHPENHVASDLDTAIRHQGVTRLGIKIGRNCWIGSKVTILDGVEIGDGSIIAAGAVVNKSFPANSVIGGVPAKLLKSRI